MRHHVLELMKKDMEAALSLAASVGVRLPSAEAAYHGGAEIFGLREADTLSQDRRPIAG
jgi:3-hydroxyisobutyrate dehydrogenase-like beta-hydroxyacid dehydrogenase